jgi:hypothetical protein
MLKELILNGDGPLADFVGGHDLTMPPFYVGEKLHRVRFRSTAKDFAEVPIYGDTMFAQYTMPIYVVLTAIRFIVEVYETDAIRKRIPLIDIDSGEILAPGTSLSTSMTQWR